MVSEDRTRMLEPLHATTSTRPPAARPRRPLGRRILRSWRLYILLAPAVAWTAVFSYWPLYGIQIAFRDFSPATGLAGGRWVGLKHFVHFVHSYQFEQLLRNTILLHGYELLVAFPAAIVLALLLNAVRQRLFSRFVQIVTFAPYFISVVVVVAIMVTLLDPQTGVVNALLAAVGIGPIDLLSRVGWFRHLYVLSSVWQTAGFSAVIYLAALTAVSPELHEAARVDGASRLRQMWHLDLPTILPVAMILLVLNVGVVFANGFEKVLLLQNPLNLDASQVVSTYVYQVGLQSRIPQYSYATAIGIFNGVINTVLLLLVNHLARRTARTSLF